MRIRSLLAGSLAMLLLPAAAHAQVTIDVTKITCKEFIIGRIVPTKSMALWFSGYYNGKRGTTTVDTTAFQTNVDKITDYCALHQDVTVMAAIETVLGVK